MLNQYNMSTNILILEIKKKTSANFWKDVKEGDKLTLVYKLKKELSFRADYRPVIYVYKDGIEVFQDTANSLLKNMEKFDVIEC